MAIIRFIFGLIITICIALFAVLNRAEVSFIWSPVNDPIALPIYVVALAAMAFGFIFGGTIVWVNAGKLRKERRKQRKNIKMLEKEVVRLKEDKFKTVTPSSDMLPVLQ